MNTEKVGDFIVSTRIDEMADSPRAFSDFCAAVMCLHHNRHSLPWEFEIPFNKLAGGSWDAIRDSLRKAVRKAGDEIVAILPIYMLDHNGLHFSLPALPLYDSGDPFQHLYMGMDSGKVGYIFTTRKMVLYYFGWKIITKKRFKQVMKTLAEEVEAYDAYCSGQIYEYVISYPNGEEYDGCGNFVNENYAMEAGKKMAERATAYRKKKPA